MPTAKCKICSTIYHGWSLIHNPGQLCDCGGNLVIIDDSTAETDPDNLVALLRDNGYSVIEGADNVIDAIEREAHREHDFLNN